MLRWSSLPYTYTKGSEMRSPSCFHTGSKHVLRKSYSSGPFTEVKVWLPQWYVWMHTHIYYSNLYYIALPAADMTFSASPGNEKVRKTIVADAAMLVPSPESFTVTLVGSNFSS